MLKLFISYKHDEETLKLINTIVSKLKSVNYGVWLDSAQLRTGDRLTLEIERGIIASDVVICFITKKYIEARNCQLEFFYSANTEKKCIYILLEGIDRKTPNGMNMYIFGNAIRFDAFKRKKENLEKYADVVFEEIIKSLNKNPTPQLMDQAVGQVTDVNIPSAIGNIEISNKESGNLILEFIFNFFDFIYFLGLFQLNSTFGGNTSSVWSLIETKSGHIASGHFNGQIKIWDQRTRECIGEWEGHTDGVNRLILRVALLIKLLEYGTS